MPIDNGWPEYKRLVLEEIRELKEDIKLLTVEQIKTRVEIERLKIKASLWGAAAGAVPVLVFYFMKEVNK